MAIALLALSLVSMTSIQQDVFAQSQGISITAMADRGSDIITITGKTISSYTDVTFKITSPSGNNIVDVDQVTPDGNGDFETKFKISEFWKEDGYYSITAKQGGSSLYTLSVLVEVNSGMAERTFITESNLETGMFVPNMPDTARETGLEIYAEAEMGSDMIKIIGWTDKMNQDITLTVIAPNENIVSVDQVSPMLDGEFTSVIVIGGSLWKQDGFYTVTAQQSNIAKYIASVKVDIKDGVVVPEFGTIAAMILAIAIISIIAISAKSRLSIIPRY